MTEDPGGDDLGNPALEAKRQLRIYKRRLELIRAEQAKIDDNAWRDLFRKIELVLREVHGNPRLMADPEISHIVKRMKKCPDLEALNVELRLLAERLGEMAGNPVFARASIRQAKTDDSIGLMDLARSPNGRMRLRL